MGWAPVNYPFVWYISLRSTHSLVFVFVFSGSWSEENSAFQIIARYSVWFWRFFETRCWCECNMILEWFCLYALEPVNTKILRNPKIIQRSAPVRIQKFQALQIFHLTLAIDYASLLRYEKNWSHPREISHTCNPVAAATSISSAVEVINQLNQLYDSSTL